MTREASAEVRKLMYQANSLRQEFAALSATTDLTTARAKASAVRYRFQQVADRLRITYGRKINPLIKEEEESHG